MTWCGRARQGTVWSGKAGYGLVWQARQVGVCCGWTGSVKARSGRHGKSGRVQVCYAALRLGMAGVARYGKVRRGMVWQGSAGVVWKN